MNNSTTGITNYSTIDAQTRRGGYQPCSRLEHARGMTANEAHLRNEADASPHFGGESKYAEAIAGSAVVRQKLRCMSYHHVETSILDHKSNLLTDGSNRAARSKSSILREQNREQTQGNELFHFTTMEQDADFVVVKVSSRFTIDQSVQGTALNTVKLTNHVEYEWGPATEADIVLKMIDIKISKNDVRTECVRPFMRIDASQLQRYFPSPY